MVDANFTLMSGRSPAAPEMDALRGRDSGAASRSVWFGRANSSRRTVVAAAGSGVDLTIHTELGTIEGEWRAFETTADCTPFGSIRWIAALCQHILAQRNARPAIVCGRNPDGVLLFILPLAIERRGGLRRLTWLGSELCDYNAPLLAPAFAAESGARTFPIVWREIRQALLSDPRFRFDVVDLEKMPEAVGGQANPFLALPVMPHPSNGHVATLSGDWPSFHAAKRSAATRKTERKKLNQLRGHGEVRFVEAVEPHEVARTLDALFSQKSAWFARMGIENIFARVGYRAFFREVAADRDCCELTHVTRLDVGETTAATAFALQFRGRYYLIASSYGDGQLARLGPGRIHLYELLRHAIESGCTYFDFTVGDEAYKREWAEIEVRLCDHLAAGRWRGWPAVAAIASYRRAKRLVKKTPSLWRAFTKARALTRGFLIHRSRPDPG